MHDLQPLNAISLKESSIPPNLDQFVDQFLSGKCFTILDLHWGFDARKMDEASRDMTAFLTPLGLLRITSLPTGFTNSPSEFQECMVFIFQDEIISQIMNVFIDDAPIRGPSTIYSDSKNPFHTNLNGGARSTPPNTVGITLNLGGVKNRKYSWLQDRLLGHVIWFTHRWDMANPKQ